MTGSTGNTSDTRARRNGIQGVGVSFVPDRNAGVWKPVYLRVTGSVSVNHALVNSDLSLAESTARLTVFANLRNLSAQPVSGTLKGTISRPGKPAIHFEQSVTNLSAGEDREVAFAPEKFPELVVTNPDLWWPYTMGTPALYDLQLEFVRNETLSDSSHLRFGIRKITQLRDNDEQFPDIGKGGNFYLQVNGRDFLVRGGDYTPDLLYRYDPQREADILRYAKDLGINFLRWESKISSEHIVELADEEGIPLMFGWMCCNQWEKWNQWSEEDRRVAPESLRSQILMLRPHASVFVWANGSDGLPPEPIRQEYHRDSLRTALAKRRGGYRLFFREGCRTATASGTASAWKARIAGGRPITGSAENTPPPSARPSSRATTSTFPLWRASRNSFPRTSSGPSTTPGSCTPERGAEIPRSSNIRLALNQRYGPSTNVEDFVRKAQLAHYENTRAQFENFAASGWATHKMVGYWMLNSHWPSFYGNLIDYYLSPGGAYYGAKKGLRPLSVVFDYYATGDNSQARIIVFNQTPGDVRGLRVRVRIYDLDGKVRDDRSTNGIAVPFNGATQVMALPRYPESSPVFFVRCQLFDDARKTRRGQHLLAIAERRRPRRARHMIRS